MIRFVDLFAGIGGFHLAIKSVHADAECVMASEIDVHAADIYRRNFLSETESSVLQGDITKLVPLDGKISSTIPQEFEVLTGGFPCQPFSKGGAQKGIAEARGTLFFHIAKILESRKPKVVFLENVRNLVGPKHFESTWLPIITLLRELGYDVSSAPTILSPHLFRPENGGSAQIRDRVFIFGVYVGRDEALKRAEENNFRIPYEFEPGWTGQSWQIEEHVRIEHETLRSGEKLTQEREDAMRIWQDFLVSVGDFTGTRVLPGFPIWERYLCSPVIASNDFPAWKQAFIEKNSVFYSQNKSQIDSWRQRNPKLLKLSESYRKFEWQAANTKSFNDCVVQFRPSGLRVKKASYFPALVAMAQTPYVPAWGRTLSVAEAARLQGFPQNFDFGEQSSRQSFKQLGNAVNVGLVAHVFRRFCEQYNVSF